MNKKQILLGATAVILGGSAVSPHFVEAYQGDPNVHGPNYTVQRHEAMTQAFENNDYNAWREQMEGQGRVTEVVNEENFARFAKAQQLAAEGKDDEAREIRQELGLGLKNGAGQGQHRGRQW